MSWSEKIAALPPRWVAVATALIAVGGLAGMVTGFVIGSAPLAFVAGAVTLTANLIPAIADWCRATSASEAASGHSREAWAVEPEVQERLAELETYYACLRNGPEKKVGGRYQDLVSSSIDPAGWDRVH
jgi:hypothetical protein